MRRLRVVFLGHTAALSGTELGLVQLVGALDAVEPIAVLAEDGPLVPRLERAGARVEVLPLGDGTRLLRRDSVRAGGAGLAPAALGAAGYSLRLARRLRRLRADLVHANTLKSFLYGAVAARLARTPLVWYVHDRIAPDYLPGAAVRLLRLAGRHVPAGILASSDTILDTLGPLRAPASVVGSPIAAGGWARPREHGGAFTAGIVGRLAPWKGQDVFLRAFAEAFPHGPERAVVVGAALFGEEGYERELEALARELGLEGRVELRGFREDVGAELASLDALVHASVLPEPFGRVIVEGMSAGLPVVAAAAGGPLELLHDGVDGLLYPAGDVRALAEGLRRLAADPGLRRRLGEAAASRAAEWGPEPVAAKTVALYRRALAASGSTAERE